MITDVRQFRPLHGHVWTGYYNVNGRRGEVRMSVHQRLELIGPCVAQRQA
jgi:hypothetical protein